MQTPKEALRVSFSQVGAANMSMSFLKRYLYDNSNNNITRYSYVCLSSAELQPSFVETVSSRYNLEHYGLVQPLQVREVLKTSRDHGEYIV